MKLKSVCLLGCWLVFAVLTGAGRCAESWYQFRGPTGQGHAAADPARIPVAWGESKNVVWKAKLPGSGWSSPVVADGQAWMTAAVVRKATPEEQKRKLAKVPNSGPLEIAAGVSLRAIGVNLKSGKVVHDLELFQVESPEPIHSLNSYASPTPVVRGGRLYCHFGSYGTACVDTRTAKVAWTNREFQVDHQNGPGASPVLWRDRLLLHFDGRDKQFVVGLDIATGKPAWKTTRTGKLNSRDDFRKAYCTPLVVESGGRWQMISPGADWVYSYDPADGRELWRAAYGKLGFSTVPRPVVGHGMAYICTSFLQSRLVAVKLDGSGDVSDTHVAWTEDRQVPKMPSLLLSKHRLYLLADGGILSCLDARSGKLIWRKRIDGQYSASPLLIGDRIYLCEREGRTIVIRDADEYELLAENELDGRLMASPAVADNSLLLRTDTHLYRISKR